MKFQPITLASSVKLEEVEEDAAMVNPEVEDFNSDGKNNDEPKESEMLEESAEQSQEEEIELEQQPAEEEEMVCD